VTDLGNIATHLRNTSLVAGHVREGPDLITSTANAVVVMKREVGAHATPETPVVKPLTGRRQSQMAGIDVPASLCVETWIERIRNRANLPAIVTKTGEIIVVNA